MLFIAISNIFLLCPILSSFLLIRLTFFFNRWGSSWIRKMMQLNKHALMFFSLLCDSIGATLENHTLKARLIMKSPKHLQWNILQMKTGQPSLNTGLIQSIRYAIYIWSDHILNLYLCMCLTSVSSYRLTVWRTRPTVLKWNSNIQQDLVAILHTARLL